MPTSPTDIEDVLHPDLRPFVRGPAGSARRSVLVELGGAAPKVTIRSAPPSRGSWTAGPATVVDLGDDSGRPQEMDRLAEELAALGLKDEPVRLDSAEAFVLRVTPAELRKVAELPLVGVIRPNQIHRVPGSKAAT